MDDIESRSAKKLATELKSDTIIFYGEEEGRRYPPLKIRSEETLKLARNATLVVVKGAPHDIEHPEYQAAIKTQIS